MSEKKLTRVNTQKKSGQKELPIGVENISFDEQFREAVKLFEEGQYIESIDILTSILKIQEDDLVRQYLARCYYRLEKFEIAYKHFALLADSSSTTMQDYGKSMLAVLESQWGNYTKAIKILRSLPKTISNLLNYCILSWEKFKVDKDELALYEALKILNSLNIDPSKTYFLKILNHTKAIIYQSLKDYRLAASYYNDALKFANNAIARSRILNDYASLHIECSRYDEAEKLLAEVKNLVQDQSDIQESYYHKWMGILEKKRKKFIVAKVHLEKAAKVIKDHDLIREVAEVNWILAEIAQKEGRDFIEAADYYSEGLIHMRHLKEVTSTNEKINDFYHDCFFGSGSDDPRPG